MANVPTMHVIFGPSGAGKTTYAHAFARREGAVDIDEGVRRARAGLAGVVITPPPFPES